MNCLLTLNAEPSARPQSASFTMDLSAITAAMLPLAGGKAANLGELIRAGFAVPGGYCITTEAYRQFAESISIPFEALSLASQQARAQLAAQTRADFLAVEMPHAIAAEILVAYRALGDSVPVAVRSSATAEDLPHASFAGQQDTYLNVTGPAAVLDAVRRCWASLWTERAVAYRTTQGINHSAVRLAVVVQRMVDAQTAGVLFTANPVTGSRVESVIDASPGLGEAVVSGSVNPDHFVIDTAAAKIVERRTPGEPCLNDPQVMALAALGRKVEAYFRAPQDIEWAFDASGALWLTQSRPITTLFPIPLRNGEAKSDRRVFFCFSLAQGLECPITPLGLAAFRLIGSAAAEVMNIPVPNPRSGPHAYAESALRLFIDITDTLRSRAGRTVLLSMFEVMEARSAATLRQLVEEPEFGFTINSWLPFLRRVARAAIRYRIPLYAAGALLNPERARATTRLTGEQIVARLSLPPGVSMKKRLDFLEQALGAALIAMATSTMPVFVMGMAMLTLAGKLLGADATPEELQTVLRGLPHNVTTEMDIELWNLARSIRKDPQAIILFATLAPVALCEQFQKGVLPPSIQNGLSEFLAVYGHRSVAEIDLGIERWSENPAHVFGVLANYLRLAGDSHAPDALFARGAAEAESMIDTLTHRALFRGTLRGRLVAFALGRARQLMGLRELPKYYLVKILAAVRQELLRIGGELAWRGNISAPGDVAYLDFAGLRAAIGGASLHNAVADRRRQYEDEMRRRHIPRVVLSDGTEPETRIKRTAAAAGSLTGTPASAGTMSAPARVILDPVGAHIEPGEILVTRSTDPGWTPLFLTAGGLVVETGGANSHGAVVAREYGIPAVVGVPDATTRIQTGDRITIDGAAGLITLAAQRLGCASLSA